MLLQVLLPMGLSVIAETEIGFQKVVTIGSVPNASDRGKPHIAALLCKAQCVIVATVIGLLAMK